MTDIEMDGIDAELADALAEWLTAGLAAGLAEPPVESEAARHNRQTAEMISTCRDPELVRRMLGGPLALRRRVLNRHPWIEAEFSGRIGAPSTPSCRTHLAPARAPRRTRTRCRARRAAHRGRTRAGPGGDDDPHDDDPGLAPPHPSPGGAT